MSHIAPQSVTPIRTINVRLSGMVVPSWILSLSFHAALLYLVGTSLKGCDSPGPGASGEEFRRVGLYVTPNSADEPEAVPTESPLENAISSPSSPTELETFEQTPPSELLLPPEEVFSIGAGSLPTEFASNLEFDDEFLKPSGGAPPTSSASAGEGEVAFFGVKDKGAKIVFVVDHSGSMYTHKALMFAKAELMASLGRLGSNQEFQIIFYSETPVAMKDRDQQSRFFPATEINRTLARHFIGMISPEAGTKHLPALMSALEMKPDIIYFLTDSGEPELDAKDLALIKQAGKGTRIHCIEFGVLSSLTSTNFLTKLARDNGGMYIYRDVSKFDRPQAEPR